jgi:hypothetical protein
MVKRNFRRVQEDFICEVCRAEVVGNGYTNHCPHCLSSKHVDVKPGDRAAQCGGVMYPISIEQRGKSTYLIHECSVCGHKKPNKTAPNDSMRKIIELSRQLSLRK